MFANYNFQILGSRGDKRAKVVNAVKQNGGTIKRMVADGNLQVVIYEQSPYLSNYSLSRAYQNNIPVVDREFIDECCDSKIFSYEQAVVYSKQKESKYRKRKRKEQEIEPVNLTPTKTGSLSVIRPLKVKKCVDYSEHTSSEIDMQIDQDFLRDKLTDLQTLVQEQNKLFKRWDLDDIQQQFFSQFLVEIDKSVFEIELNSEMVNQLSILKEILEKEKNQQSDDSFLKAFIKSYQDNNKLSPFSIFFKLDNDIIESYWESTIQSIVSKLFLLPVSYEKNIIFGTSELSNQYLSEALKNRAEWLKEHKKLQDKQDLYPDFFFTKTLFGEETYDTFLISEAQRNDFENDDVFLHKDICNLTLYMRCMFKNLIERLKTNNCLTIKNLQKTRLFGALIAGTTIAWLEMRLKFCTQFEPVEGKSLPPFTYCMKISDIYDLTNVEGMAKSLMILQHTFDLVNTLTFEPGESIRVGAESTAVLNTGNTVDTSKVYASLISLACFHNDTVDLFTIIFELNSDLSTLGEVYNVPQLSTQEPTSTNSNLENTSGFDFSLFLKENKLEQLSDMLPFKMTTKKIITQEACTIASINPSRSINLYMNEPTESIPILLMFKQGSTLNSVLVKPINEDGWKLALKAKPLLEKSQQDYNDNGDYGRENSRNKNKNKKEDNANSNPIIEQQFDKTLLENVEQMSNLRKKFQMMTKNNSIIPSIYSLLDCYENRTMHYVYCRPHVAAQLVIVFRTVLQHGDRRRFIKITHSALNEIESMKYLQGLDIIVKLKCNHVAQIHKFEQVFLKDNHELFFAVYLMNKKHFGKETCKRLKIDDFDSPYTQHFFDAKTRIELTFMELLEPIRIEEILKIMSTFRDLSSKLKILISIRWIGQCLTMLNQLHSNLNILHCDISFDNIMTREGAGGDNLAQIIQEQCDINGIKFSELLISDLVVSDLNTSVKLQPIQNNENDESRSTITRPDAIKFPYTWHTYEFYGTMQADNYAMAIFIAKLIKRLVFEDFNDFTIIDKMNTITFNQYRESVYKYFEEKRNDENIDPIQNNFLSGVSELLLYILDQKKETPSKLSSCIKIYQSKIEHLVHHYR